MAEPASKLTERLRDEADHTKVNYRRDLLREAARALEQAEDALEECEAYAKEGWDWLGKALRALGASTVFDIEARASALEQAEKALREAQAEARHGLTANGQFIDQKVGEALAALGGQDGQVCPECGGTGEQPSPPHLHLPCVVCGGGEDGRDKPWDESQEGVEADRPTDLPIPANADKRYEELDGG